MIKVINLITGVTVARFLRKEDISIAQGICHELNGRVPPGDLPVNALYTTIDTHENDLP